ncbi:hypothetical protein HaLaN_25082 [Haematococcus lacustris]|uniref:Secreted protein n=1 Tax=Haematococcus lacustris TaxID=44745 RepID=A0A699ZW08_HAELA|nr:hypothetical protein HaLaN_25082 [Haematococcus lacustris]
MDGPLVWTTHLRSVLVLLPLLPLHALPSLNVMHYSRCASDNMFCSKPDTPSVALMHRPHAHTLLPRGGIWLDLVRITARPALAKHDRDAYMQKGYVAGGYHVCSISASPRGGVVHTRGGCIATHTTCCPCTAAHGLQPTTAAYPLQHMHCSLIHCSTAACCCWGEEVPIRPATKGRAREGGGSGWVLGVSHFTGRRKQGDQQTRTCITRGGQAGQTPQQRLAASPGWAGLGTRQGRKRNWALHLPHQGCCHTAGKHGGMAATAYASATHLLP